MAAGTTTLTRAQEAELASRVERGLRRILVALLDSPRAIDELVSAAEAAGVGRRLASEVLVDIDPGHDLFDEAGRRRVLAELVDSVRRYRDEQQATRRQLALSSLADTRRARLEAIFARRRAALLTRLSWQSFRTRVLEQAVTRVKALVLAGAGEDARDDLEPTLREIRDGARVAAEARAELVRAHLSLVVAMARRYANRGVELSDLAQEGSLGLLRAIETFDHRRGCRLSTYAVWWIRESISTAVAEQTRIIHLPSSLRHDIHAVDRATGGLALALGRRPTSEEIAARAHLSLDRVRLIAEVARPTISLETPIRSDDLATLEDLLEDRRAPSPAQGLCAADLADCVESALGALSEREAAIVRLHHGIGGECAHSLKEIGCMFGVSRERVRQIEDEALARLRRARHGERLRPLLDGWERG